MTTTTNQPPVRKKSLRYESALFYNVFFFFEKCTKLSARCAKYGAFAVPSNDTAILIEQNYAHAYSIGDYVSTLLKKTKKNRKMRSVAAVVEQKR